MRNLKDVGKRLSEICCELGLTQLELASKIGINKDFLSQIKRGGSPMSAETADRIERKCGYRSRWLRHGEGPKMVAEETPEYTAEEAAFPVLVRTALHCGQCYGEVVRGIRRCPHCGARLIRAGKESEGEKEAER